MANSFEGPPPVPEKERQYGDLSKEMFEELQAIGVVEYLADGVRSLVLTRPDGDVAFIRKQSDDEAESWSKKVYDGDDDEHGQESKITNEIDITNLQELSLRDLPKGALEALESNATVKMDYDEPLISAVGADGVSYHFSGIRRDNISIRKDGKAIDVSYIKNADDEKFLEDITDKLVQAEIDAGRYIPGDV